MYVYTDYSLLPLLVQQNYIDVAKNGVFRAPGISDDTAMLKLSEVST